MSDEASHHPQQTEPVAFLFPGQGSQRVGMGRALAAAFGPARAVFDEVDEALGEPLSRLMFEGPEADLPLTRNAQPALMAVSAAPARTPAAPGGLAGEACPRARGLAGALESRLRGTDWVAWV